MTVSKFNTWTFSILLLLSAISVIHLLFGYITPILMATVIVSIFKPMYNKILFWTGNKEYLSSGLATLVVFLGVLIPIAFFMISLVQQASNLLEATGNLTSTTDISQWMISLRAYLDNVNAHLDKFNIKIASERIINAASTLSQAIGEWIYDALSTAAAHVIEVIINFLLTVALVFIFFINGRNTKDFILELIPLPLEDKERLVLRFRELSHAVFVGNGLMSVLEGILGGLSFWACGITGAVFWGFVITVTAFLPLVGASIVIIPASIYLFLVGQTGAAIIFFVFNTVQLTILETFVKPRLIGTKSHMNAALVFMSILAGIEIYGFFGLFYGPLLVTIFLTMAQLYKEHYQKLLLKS